MNLLCWQGLTRNSSTEVVPLLEALHAMAARVDSETERHLYRFKSTPSDYENSEGFFRMVMLGVVLAEDFGIQYDPQRRADPGESSTTDRFFSDPDAVFLSGLLGPERKGTCSSLPVLYVAIGRELGYPLKLVTTKGHLFVRWEGEVERFNIETTSHGVNRFDDDYYRHWPFEISRTEEAAEGYLRSLSPPGELAVFLSIRGMCLRDMGRISEAADAFAAASRLAPRVASYKYMAAALKPGVPLTQTAPR